VVVALDLAVDRLHLDVVAGLHPEQRQLAAVGAERERERERERDSAPTSARYQAGEGL
jgi:hypothetical protein